MTPEPWLAPPLTYIEVSTGRVVETVGNPYKPTVIYRYRGEEPTRKLSAGQFYMNGWFVAWFSSSNPPGTVSTSAGPLIAKNDSSAER